MALLEHYDRTTARLRGAGDFVWPLFLRLIMFWEVWESGVAKYRGNNWFQHIPLQDWQKGFPWPFSDMPTNVNWALATWGELLFSTLLLLGLFTRFAAFSLIIIIAVAAAAVHWPNDWTSMSSLWEAYAISYRDGYGFKLALLFILLLLPLVFHGGGRLSLDRVLLNLTGRGGQAGAGQADLAAAGLSLMILGLTVVFLEPAWGLPLLLAAAVALLLPLLRSRR